MTEPSAGSGRRATAALCTLTALFALAFVWQRGRSPFLAVEARASEARALAEDCGLRPVEVMALHELLGGALSREAWRERSDALAIAARELGDVRLGVLVVVGERARAERLRAASSGDAARLDRALAADRGAAESAGRFASVAARYASRGY